MMKKLLYIFFLSSLLISQIGAEEAFESTKDLPVSYQGRFRSLDSAARLWLYDFYHQQELKKEDLPLFYTNSKSALDLLWKMHFFGYSKWDEAPFFWIQQAKIKEEIGLPLKQDRFSFNVLKEKLLNQEQSQNEWILPIKHALRTFGSYQGTYLAGEKGMEKAFYHLQKNKKSPQEIAQLMEEHYPLQQRLKATGSTMKMLPCRNEDGEWLSLHAFKAKVYNPKQQALTLASNFTSFSDKQFETLREAYLALEHAVLAANLSPPLSKDIEKAAEEFSNLYHACFQELIHKPYKIASGKELFYPSFFRLHAETLYYQLPLINAAILIYSSVLLCFFMSFSLSKSGLQKLGIFLLIVGFLLHTLMLALRCYILQRPPVSNMFETVIYVPWIAVLMGWFFFLWNRAKIVLIAATISSLILFIILKLAALDARMENVQAVLDSQYWLVVHVLLVVGSYGAFILSGTLGHGYFLALWSGRQSFSDTIIKAVLHTMYLGVAMLIPGTILGGIWAAESWGRFWDWDPKEAWAFISACIYLLVIHAYTFRRAGEFGLAIGAIAGLMAVSFTWYGVNYILGTGLHSYGFGKGGEMYYFLYLAMELFFLIGLLLGKKRIMSLNKNG